MNKLTDYKAFVSDKLSDPSSDFNALIESLENLRDRGSEIGVKIPELVTAMAGLSSESGEFAEIVKKMIFQGKELNEDNRFHMKRELGDIMFYAMVACTALGYTPNEIIDENYNKLTARYKDGFTVAESEYRAKGDL